MEDGILVLCIEIGEAITFGEGKHGFRFGVVEGRSIAGLDGASHGGIVLHSSKSIYNIILKSRTN